MQVIPKTNEGLIFYQTLAHYDGTVKMLSKTWSVHAIIGRAVTLKEVVNS